MTVREAIDHLQQAISELDEWNHASESAVLAFARTEQFNGAETVVTTTISCFKAS